MQPVHIAICVGCADVREPCTHVFKRAAQDVFGNFDPKITAETVQGVLVEMGGIAWLQNRNLFGHNLSFLTPTRDLNRIHIFPTRNPGSGFFSRIPINFDVSGGDDHKEAEDFMNAAKPLPAYLVQRYQGWKATTYSDNRAWYKRLATEGQRPRAMVISCCDSRVHVTSIFGADQGEFFIHRNIANLVPPYEPDGDHHGTSAAIEYAVTALHVAHLIVLGHSQCGGVQGCLDMCSGNAPHLEEQSSFVGRWMDILRPGYDRVSASNHADGQARALEKESVIVSLENLMTFPFIREAVDSDQLTLHGLWTDIAEGGLEFFDPKSRLFQPV